MPKYRAQVPVYATARYELDTEEEITDPAELQRRMLKEGRPTGAGVCGYCSDDFEIDDPGNPDEYATRPDAFEVERVED